MNISLSKQRLLAFIAITSILLNALAPSISHLIASKNTLPWQQICTQNSIKLIASVMNSGNLLNDITTRSNTSQQNDNNQSGHLPMVDCGYCVTHAGSDSVFSKSFSLTVTTITLRLFPALFYSSPDKLFIWAASNPRAPPVISSH